MAYEQIILDKSAGVYDHVQPSRPAERVHLQDARRGEAQVIGEGKVLNMYRIAIVLVAGTLVGCASGVWAFPYFVGHPLTAARAGAS